MRLAALLLVSAALCLAQQNGNPKTADFPTSVATDVTLGIACNSARSTLAIGVTDISLSMTVVSGATLCAPAYYTLGSGTAAEVVKVCSVSGNIATVCANGRGVHGNATPHSDGTTVQILNDENYTNQMGAEMKAVQEGLGAGFANVALLSRGSNVFTGNLTVAGTLSGGDIYSTTGAIYTTAGGSFNWPARSQMTSPSAGVILFQNNTGTDFARLQLGGSAATFPAIKRTGAGISIRLADDSGDATLNAGGGVFSGGLDVAGVVQHRSNLSVQNKAANGWIAWATRNTAGAESVMDLSNLGNVTGTQFNGPLNGNATTVTNGVYTSGSYTDPAWLNISKGKVGLGNVENTALSTWPGSANITTVGTLATHLKFVDNTWDIGASGATRPRNYYGSGTGIFGGTVTATQFNGSGAGLTSATIPIAAHVAGNYASVITSGSYSISITGSSASTTGNAATATNVAYSGITALPQFASGAVSQRVRMADVGCSGSYATSCDAGGNGLLDTADNANTVGGLAVSSGGVPGANQVLRTDGSAYQYAGWINTTSGDNGTTAVARVYASNDGFIRYYTLDNFGKQVLNGRQFQGSFAVNDPYAALPTGYVFWGVFQPQGVQSTINMVQCWSDTNDAVINLRRQDPADFINGNLTCNGSQTTNISNGYQVIPVGYYVGLYVISGTAKSIRLGFRYTTAY